MIEKFKKLLNSDLIKVFSFTGLSTLVKLLTSYITIKVIATIIGPGGIALVGQLQNFTAIFTTLGAGGINNGVVKYVSEYKDKEDQLHQYLQNGFRITVFLSLFFGAVLIVLARPLSLWILLSAEYSYVFVFFGISLFLLSLNNYFLSILNGFKEFKKFVTINIITSIIGLFFTVGLVLLFQLKGALIATVSYQSVVLFATVFYLKNSPWFQKKILWGKANKVILRKFLSFSLMAVVSAATVPVSQLLVRAKLITDISLDSAGYWEGMNRISGMFLLFVTTSFSVYYLPKLSEIKIRSLLKKEIFNTYKIITPLVLGSLILLYVLKDVVINILFTAEFYPMKDLFLWQLMGDFFKIMSWILAFLMVAKSMTKLYIITEVVFSVLLVLISYILINKNGLIGASQSYCINYMIYLVVMILIFRKLLFKHSKKRPVI